jgi:PhnB protein
MSPKVNLIPAGYHSVTPYLAIKGASDAIEFYKKAFGAVEVLRMPGPGDTIGHAEVKIGDSRVMLADEFPDLNFFSPNHFKGSSIHIHLYVEDVDSVFNRALKAGAREVRPLRDEFYGDRTGSLEDPFGHVWHVASHVKDLSMEEITKAAAKIAGGDK